METGVTKIIFIIVGFSHGAHVKLWTWNAKSRRGQKSGRGTAQKRREGGSEGGRGIEVYRVSHWLAATARDQRQGISLSQARQMKPQQMPRQWRLLFSFSFSCSLSFLLLMGSSSHLLLSSLFSSLLCCCSTEATCQHARLSAEWSSGYVRQRDCPAILHTESPAVVQ